MGMAHAVQNDNVNSSLWETKDRTSISLVLKDEPGILNKALGILTENNIDMTRI